MNPPRGSGCIAPLGLHVGTRWRWGVSFMPLPLISREISRKIIHWIGGWVGSWTSLDLLGKGKISRPCQDWNPGSCSQYPSCCADYTIQAPPEFTDLLNISVNCFTIFVKLVPTTLFRHNIFIVKVKTRNEGGHNLFHIVILQNPKLCHVKAKHCQSDSTCRFV